MLQRQPRVGDIVDDYCPRERRVSDHAVVAMVGDGIRQTRCTTCDTEHEYRQAKVPPARKKPVTALAPKPKGQAAPAAVPKPPEPVAETEPLEVETSEAQQITVPEPQAPPPGVEGPVHRRLIRAVLPRVEGEVPTRQAPEFTMHRPVGQRPAAQGRGQRPGGGGPARQGAKGASGHSRFGGARGASGNASPGGRGGRAGQGGHSSPAGHSAHGNPRHGRPHHSGSAPRKKH